MAYDPQKKKSKLSKMQMPESEAEMPMDSEMEPEMAAEGDKAEPPMEDDSSGVEPTPMADLEGASDEDLMAEIRKRGLMSELESSEQMPAEDDLGMA